MFLFVLVGLGGEMSIFTCFGVLVMVMFFVLVFISLLLDLIPWFICVVVDDCLRIWFGSCGFCWVMLLTYLVCGLVFVFYGLLAISCFIISVACYYVVLCLLLCLGLLLVIVLLVVYIV